MTRILFVCTGNICRSPTAEGVFRHLAVESGLNVETDSAGLGAWHAGNPPDRRSVAAAARRGYDISGLRARQIEAGDFQNFDLLLAMDRGHLREMTRLAPRDHAGKVRLYMSAAGQEAPDVADPYYGGADGFETVLDMIETGARAWLHELRRAG